MRSADEEIVTNVHVNNNNRESQSSHQQQGPLSEAFRDGSNSIFAPINADFRQQLESASPLSGGVNQAESRNPVSEVGTNIPSASDNLQGTTQI